MEQVKSNKPKRADLATRFQKGHKVPDEWKKTMGGSTRFSKGGTSWNAGTGKINLCADCGKQTAYRYAKRCVECSKKQPSKWLGRKHTEETNEKNRKATTERWKDPLFREKVMKARVGTQLGDKNGLWKGGISFEPYCQGWNKTLKESIRSRDKYKCQVCTVPQEELSKALHVHHIDEVKKNLNPDNLIALCQSCHLKVHHGSAVLTTGEINV